MQALHGTGGKEQMSGLMRSGINPQRVNVQVKSLGTVRPRVKGKSSQEQLFWLSQWGGEGLLPLTMQSDKEFEGNLSFARENSSKSEKLGKNAYDNESYEAKRDANLAASADELGNNIVPLLKEFNKFLSEHKDAVAYATGAIWALGTAASVVAGIRGLGALIKGPVPLPGGGGGGGSSLGGAGSFAALSRLGVGAGLALYSPDLNSGEDDEIRRGHIGLPGYDAQGNHLPNLPSGGGRMVGGRIGGISNGNGLGSQKQNMQGVLRAFMNQGLSLEQAQIMAAEVGRESSFDSKNLFGNHTDPANGAKNVGMLSWQGPRAANLLQHLSVRGLIDDSGNIRQTQAALNAQAAFSVGEMTSGKNSKWSKAWAVLNDPSASRVDKSNAVGRNFVQWAIDNPKFSAGGIKNREDYYAMLTSANESGSMINSNNQTSEVRIDNINIQADTKDVNMIASSLPNAIKSAGILPGFVRGQN